MINPSFIVRFTADEFYRAVCSSLLNLYHNATDFSPPYHLNELPEPFQAKFRAVYAEYLAKDIELNKVLEELFELYRNGRNSV